MALSDKQIEVRRTYLGGSDARTVLEGDGDAWKALRDQKVLGIRPEFPPAQQLLMDMGSAIEPLILRELNRKVPLKPIEPGLYHRWPDDPYLGYMPDGIAFDGDVPVQTKFHTGDKTILELAEYHKAQLVHEMICSCKTRMWLGVIFGHYGRFQHMAIQQDMALTEQYLLRAMQFKHYVHTDELPEGMELEETLAMSVPRRRDHVWLPGDNEVKALCTSIRDHFAEAIEYEESLEKMKKLIKRKEYADCASLTWRDEDGYGVMFKLNARGSVTPRLAFPARAKAKKVA